MPAKIADIEDVLDRAGFKDTTEVVPGGRSKRKHLRDYCIPRLEDIFQMLDENAQIILFVSDPDLWAVSGVWLVGTQIVNYEHSEREEPAEYMIVRTDRDLGLTRLSLEGRRLGSEIWGPGATAQLRIHPRAGGPILELKASGQNCEGLIKLFQAIEGTKQAITVVPTTDQITPA